MGGGVQFDSEELSNQLALGFMNSCVVSFRWNCPTHNLQNFLLELLHNCSVMFEVQIQLTTMVRFGMCHWSNVSDDENNKGPVDAGWKQDGDVNTPARVLSLLHTNSGGTSVR